MPVQECSGGRQEANANRSNLRTFPGTGMAAGRLSGPEAVAWAIRRHLEGLADPIRRGRLVSNEKGVFV